MNTRFKKFLALPIVLSALLVALFANVFVGTPALAETSFNISDWYYKPDVENSSVLLYKYIGQDKTYEIPATVDIDGTTYSVGLLRDKAISDAQGGKFVDFGSIEILAFEDGVFVDDYAGLFGGNDNLVEVYLGGLKATAKTTSAAGMFTFCDNLEYVSNFDDVFTSKLTSTAHMFSYCPNLQNLVIYSEQGIDTSNVTDMSCMFLGCENLSFVDFYSGFNTSSVTDMSLMFDGCSSLRGLNLTLFDTSAVTSMDGIFSGCSSLSRIRFSQTGQDGEQQGQSSVFKIPAGTTNLGIPTIVGLYEGSLYTGMWIEVPNGANSPITAEALEAKAIADGGISGTWYSQDAILDWYYEVVEDAKTGEAKVKLVEYIGEETTYTVPASYTCAGVTYPVVLAENNQSSSWENLDFGTIEDLSFEDGVCASSPERLFDGCSNLKTINLAGLTFADSSSMEFMFYGCTSLTSIDLAGFDASKAESAKGMFADCESLESIDLTGLDTSSLTNMAAMFTQCLKLKEVNLGSIDTSKVTEMTGLFYNCQELEKLDLSALDTSSAQYMQIMFDACPKLNKITFGENFVISSSADAGEMFCEPEVTAYDAVSNGKWGKSTELAKVQYTAEELAELGKREGKLEGTWYAQSDVVNDWTYYTTTIDEQDYIVLFTYRGTETDYKIPAQMTIGEKTYKVAVIGDDKHLLDPGTIQNLSFEQGVYAIEAYGLLMKTDLVSVDFTGLDTSDVTDLCDLFYKCTSLKSVKFGDIDTSNVEDMSWLFYNCMSLESVDFGSVTTSRVTMMDGMFLGCSALATVDVSSFDTSHVEDMCQMFEGCSALTELDLSNFDLSSIKTTQETEDDGTVVDWAHVDYLLYGCTSLTKLVLGENFVVPAAIEEVFPTPEKTASGSVSSGKWGQGSENAQKQYSSSGLAELGQRAGALKGTWYAQIKAADSSDDGGSDNKSDNNKSDKGNDKSGSKNGGKTIPATGDSTSLTAMAVVSLFGLALAGMGFALKKR